jgi:hypothetical protein
VETARGAESTPTDAELERAIVDAVTLGLNEVARTLAARLEVRAARRVDCPTMGDAMRRFERRKEVPRGSFAEHAPRKGFYTQGVCVLFDAVPTIPALTERLGAFELLKEAPGAEGEHGWAMGGPSLILGYRREVNGLVQVDVVDRPWPDGMGSPKDDTATLFGAWSMGHFGPSTFPGALARACEQSHAWSEGRGTAERHRAFVRVRSSYVFGVPDSARVLPAQYDAIDELRFVSQVQLALAGAPGALCAFNPNGELLLEPSRLEATLLRDLEGKGLAVDAWANVRLYNHREDMRKWHLFDTVGMSQIDVADHEATLSGDHPSFDHVPGLLYSMAAYDAEQGGVLGPNDTASDLGGHLWRAYARGEGVVTPPRTTLRWSLDGVRVPDALARSRAPR